MGIKITDLFMFMGQSNMAGRGAVTSDHPESAPVLLPNAGYEYRAVSSPGELVPISEPFGRMENRHGGIDDGDRKTGSMVTAFVNAYYACTGVPVIGVSASKGGSVISQWRPGGAYLTDAISRLDSALAFLRSIGFTVRHQFILWCQGESDADIGNTGAVYVQDFTHMLNAMTSHGIEQCFLVQIGRFNGSGRTYAPMRALQDKIAAENEGVTMVSRLFEKMKERGLMKDPFHYFQQAYNEVGCDAGKNTAKYVLALENTVDA